MHKLVWLGSERGQDMTKSSVRAKAALSTDTLTYNRGVASRAALLKYSSGEEPSDRLVNVLGVVNGKET